MLYLIFSLVIAWLVYNVVSMSNKNKTQQQRIEKLEEKIK
jgi:membrane protein implicated in regulation of membrane protease activity